MTGKNPLESLRILNGILALGVLIGLGGLAGMAATALSGSAGNPGRAENIGAPATDWSSLRPARIDGKYGYVDALGQIIIEPRFDGADTFSEGLALVLDRGRFGYIDPVGRFAIPAVFRHALPFRDGFAQVRNGRDWAFLDRSGNPVAYHEGEDADDAGGPIPAPATP